MTSTLSRHVLLHALWLAIATGLLQPLAAVAEEPDGNQIFATKCARCHGPGGAGTEDHQARLEGDLSATQLAELIGKTMPEDDPASLSAEEAQAVAAYIHGAFYSAIARARNQPARIELARLTVRQYRRAVADVISSFSNPMKLSDERGLRGIYFNSREPRGPDGRVARRIDPQVNFDFGRDAPLPDIKEPRQFSIRWRGSLYAPETGDYEFIVRTDHAARLWLNNVEIPAIDAWVKSGNDTEYKTSQYLVGGRFYALRLEFTKAMQGVDNSKKEAEKKDKPPSPPASIALLWRRPHGVPEVIPTRNLSPQRAPETFACSVPFPPDDRSYGWERGASISQAWGEATTNAAIQAAGYVGAGLNKLADTSDDSANRVEQLRAFAAKFAEQAFRRPLDDETMQAYVIRQFEEADSPEQAVQRVVLLVLKSPRFLFREVDGGSDSFNVAARLAFGLWDSIPDADLFAAAKAGELTTDQQVRLQATRMLDDVRARAKLHDFLLTWLSVDGEIDLNKDSELFPEFDAALVADLRTSLELFLDDVVSSDGSDYRNLLLADVVYLNDQLEKFYGVEADESAEFQVRRLDDGKRAGVLTHPYVMARFSYRSETSPIHRGVFLARSVLGESLRPPPEAFSPISPELHPDLTTRERVTLQTKDATCMGCHTIINPLGFTLERFDAVGRYRDEDRGKPIDDTASYETTSGATANLTGARELAQYLAASEECHAAFTEHLFHHLVQQSVQAYGPDTLDSLRQSFATNDFNIRKLAVEIMVASALTGRETSSVAP
jgi:cytochrome c553